MTTNNLLAEETREWFVSLCNEERVKVSSIEDAPFCRLLTSMFAQVRDTLTNEGYFYLYHTDTHSHTHTHTLQQQQQQQRQVVCKDKQKTFGFDSAQRVFYACRSTLEQREAEGRVISAIRLCDTREYCDTFMIVSDALEEDQGRAWLQLLDTTANTKVLIQPCTVDKRGQMEMPCWFQKLGYFSLASFVCARWEREMWRKRKENAKLRDSLHSQRPLEQFWQQLSREKREKVYARLCLLIESSQAKEEPRGETQSFTSETSQSTPSEWLNTTHSAEEGEIERERSPSIVVSPLLSSRENENTNSAPIRRNRSRSLPRKPSLSPVCASSSSASSSLSSSLYTSSHMLFSTLPNEHLRQISVPLSTSSASSLPESTSPFSSSSSLPSRSTTPPLHNRNRSCSALSASSTPIFTSSSHPHGSVHKKAHRKNHRAIKAHSSENDSASLSSFTFDASLAVHNENEFYCGMRHLLQLIHSLQQTPHSMCQVKKDMSAPCTPLLRSISQSSLLAGASDFPLSTSMEDASLVSATCTSTPSLLSSSPMPSTPLVDSTLDSIVVPAFSSSSTSFARAPTSPLLLTFTLAEIRTTPLSPQPVPLPAIGQLNSENLIEFLFSSPLARAHTSLDLCIRRMGFVVQSMFAETIGMDLITSEENEEDKKDLHVSQKKQSKKKRTKRKKSKKRSSVATVSISPLFTADQSITPSDIETETVDPMQGSLVVLDANFIDSTSANEKQVSSSSDDDSNARSSDESATESNTSSGESGWTEVRREEKKRERKRFVWSSRAKDDFFTSAASPSSMTHSSHASTFSRATSGLTSLPPRVPLRAKDDTFADRHPHGFTSLPLSRGVSIEGRTASWSKYSYGSTFRVPVNGSSSSTAMWSSAAISTSSTSNFARKSYTTVVSAPVTSKATLSAAPVSISPTLAASPVHVSSPSSPKQATPSHTPSSIHGNPSTAFCLYADVICNTSLVDATMQAKSELDKKTEAVFAPTDITAVEQAASPSLNARRLPSMQTELNVMPASEPRARSTAELVALHEAAAHRANSISGCHAPVLMPAPSIQSVHPPPLAAQSDAARSMSLKSDSYSHRVPSASSAWQRASVFWNEQQRISEQRKQAQKQVMSAPTISSSSSIAQASRLGAPFVADRSEVSAAIAEVSRGTMTAELIEQQQNQQGITQQPRVSTYVSGPILTTGSPQYSRSSPHSSGSSAPSTPPLAHTSVNAQRERVNVHTMIRNYERAVQLEGLKVHRDWDIHRHRVTSPAPSSPQSDLSLYPPFSPHAIMSRSLLLDRDSVLPSSQSAGDNGHGISVASSSWIERKLMPNSMCQPSNVARKRMLRNEAHEIMTLHNDIQLFASQVARSVASRHAPLVRLILQVRECVFSIWPHAQVLCYGSFVTGLCLPSADLDLVILNVNGEVLQALRALGTCLQAQSGWVSSVSTIETARIPVIKVNTAGDAGQTVVDITFDSTFLLNPHSQDPSEWISPALVSRGRSISQPQHPVEGFTTAREWPTWHSGVASVELIAHYVAIFPALKPLTLVIKQFLVDQDLSHTFTGGLNSYCLVMMIVSFLQSKPWPYFHYQNNVLDVQRMLWQQQQYRDLLSQYCRGTNVVTIPPFFIPTCMNCVIGHELTAPLTDTVQQPTEIAPLINQSFQDNLGALLLEFLQLFGERFDFSTTGIAVAPPPTMPHMINYLDTPIHAARSVHLDVLMGRCSTSRSTDDGSVQGCFYTLPSMSPTLYLSDPIAPPSSHNIGKAVFAMWKIRNAFVAGLEKLRNGGKFGNNVSNQHVLSSTSSCIVLSRLLHPKS